MKILSSLVGLPKSWLRTWLPAICVLLLAVLVPAARATSNFTSAWDEHAHLSYVQYAYDFKWPTTGYPMNTWGREAFACHPHQLYGPMAAAACGANGPGAAYPTGGANTAEGWPPLAYTAVANLSRPVFLFIDDPLFAVRGGVVLLWGLGMSSLAGLARRRGVGYPQIVAAIAAICALPGIGYFSSFVSPYSAVPILTAYAIWSFEWVIAIVQSRRVDRTLRFAAKSVAALAFPAVSVLAVPHTISSVIAISIGLSLFIVLGNSKARVAGSAIVSAVTGIVSVMLAGSAYLTYKVYSEINARRAIPYPSDTVPDPPAPVIEHDHDWIGQAMSRAWNFFPNAIGSALPVPRTLAFLGGLLTAFVVSVVVGRALGLLHSRDRGSLALAVLIASPIGALIFYYTLSFEPPTRYGLPLAFLGFSFLLVEPLTKRATAILMVLSIGLTAAALVSDPIYIEQPCWEVGPDGYLQQCPDS